MRPEPRPAGIGQEEVDQLEAARIKIAQLEHALRSRIVIEQAKGIIAERLGVDMDVAFDILRSAARSHRIKIHAVAERVIRERLTPEPVVVAIARGERARAAWMCERAEAQRERLGELEEQVTGQLQRAHRNVPDD
jgi:hypothetical protein